MMIQGKYNIELNYAGNSLFLNYWDWAHGNDVVAEIRNGKIYLDEKEITLSEYIELIEQSIDAALNPEP